MFSKNASCNAGAPRASAVTAVCRPKYPACRIRQHTPAYVNIRQLTSAYVSIRQQSADRNTLRVVYVSIRQHTSAYVSIRQQTMCWTRCLLCRHTSAYVSIRQPAYVSIRQHTADNVLDALSAVSVTLVRFNRLSLLCCCVSLSLVCSVRPTLNPKP
jgi:hypothetical protein